MDGRIRGSAEFYRRDGRWCVVLSAPEWVISEMALDGMRYGLSVANFGGTSGATEHSMLLTTRTPAPKPTEETADE